MKQPRRGSRPIAIGLDLGSTTIKAAALYREGRPGPVASRLAPPLSGSGATREGDPARYLDTAREVLRAIANDAPQGTPLGIATQRSSLSLWDARSGRFATPMISWQDRRAEAWCAEHEELRPEIARRTGLVLSPHYAGPKLAWLQATSRDLRDRLHAGQLRFGTMETRLAWSWSKRPCHQTDLSVAARTAMVDLSSETWCEQLLDAFAVPRSALPNIVDSARWRVPFDLGVELRASVSDQAAAALAVLPPSHRSALVNLGTGTFVLVPVPDRSPALPGYLLGPTLRRGRERRWALEGTINGSGPAVDRFAPGPTELPERDPSPAAFAIPDLAGLGSPFWRPEIGLTLSPDARQLGGVQRRRVVLEGLAFRVRAILEEISAPLPDRIFLAGGLTRDPAVGPAMAAVLARDVEILDEPDAGLVGAARLAADLDPFTSPETRPVAPGPRGAYLRDKYALWREWLASIVDA